MAAKGIATGGLYVVCISTFLVYVCGQMCTETLVGRRVEEVTKHEPCVEKFTARCSWLSLSYCSFYRSRLCERRVNETVTFHYIQTGCCAGYYMVANKTCIKKESGKDYHVEVVPLETNQEDPKVAEAKQTTDVGAEKSELSIGAYAGIICGFTFLCVVAAFIIIAVRKKQKRNSQKRPPVDKSPNPSVRFTAETAEQMQCLKAPEVETGGNTVSMATGPTVDDSEQQKQELSPNDPDRTTIV